MFRTCGRILVRCPVSFHLYIFFPPGQVELIARSKFQSLSKLDAFSRFKINTEERNRAKAGKQKKAIILGRGGGKGWVESHGTMNLFRRGGPIPRDYTPGHASFLRCVRKRLEGRHLTEQGMAIVRYIIYEKKRRRSAVHFFASRRSQTTPCVSSPLFAPSIVAAGYDLPRGRPEKWKFLYVQASIMLDPQRAPRPRMSENALRWPSSPPFYAFSFYSFTTFLDATRSSFDVVYLERVFVCVYVCARGPVFRDEETPKRGLVSLWESRYNKAYRTKYFSFFFRPLLRVGILRYFGVLK